MYAAPDAGDPPRLAVADATVGELAKPYDVSVQAVSKHLRVLEEAGLVTKTRDAQRRSVHLEADVLDLATAWTRATAGEPGAGSDGQTSGGTDGSGPPPSDRLL